MSIDTQRVQLLMMMGCWYRLLTVYNWSFSDILDLIKISHARSQQATGTCFFNL